MGAGRRQCLHVAAADAAPATLEELVAGSRDLGAKAAADKAGAKERATGKQHRTRASTGLSQELSIAAHVTPPLADVV